MCTLHDMMRSVVIPASIDILHNTFTREYSDAVIELNTRNIGVIFIEILLLVRIS